MNTHKYAIRMRPELLGKLNEMLIVEADLRDTIDYCEETGRKLRDAKTGHLIGHRRLGVMTYWVEYEMAGDECTVFNAYNHRMQIEGDESCSAPPGPPGPNAAGK